MKRLILGLSALIASVAICSEANAGIDPDEEQALLDLSAAFDDIGEASEDLADHFATYESEELQAIQKAIDYALGVDEHGENATLGSMISENLANVGNANLNVSAHCAQCEYAFAAMETSFGHLDAEEYTDASLAGFDARLEAALSQQGVIDYETSGLMIADLNVDIAAEFESWLAGGGMGGMGCP